MQQPNFIERVETARQQSIVVYGDTTGFSTFARRTSEQPEIHREFLLDLYNVAFQYQFKTGAYLKLLCDGFMFVHEYKQIPTPNQVREVLEHCARAYNEIQMAISKVRYPRPDGFRMRVAMGMTWAMKVSMKAPKNCKPDECDIETIKDYFEYPTILAARMLQIRKDIALMCCQAIRETMNGIDSPFVFKRVKTDKRVPDGIFKEDIQNLWEFTLR